MLCSKCVKTKIIVNNTKSNEYKSTYNTNLRFGYLSELNLQISSNLSKQAGVAYRKVANESVIFQTISQ